MILVVPQDFDFSAGLTEPSGATLERIRGCMNFSVSLTTATNPVFFTCGIACHDADATTPTFGGFMDPRVSAQLARQDWLWVRQFMYPTTALMELPDGLPIDIDVKARRRLKDANVTFFAAVDAFAGGGVLNINVLARSLLRMKSSG